MVHEQQGEVVAHGDRHSDGEVNGDTGDSPHDKATTFKRLPLPEAKERRDHTSNAQPAQRMTPTMGKKTAAPTKQCVTIAGKTRAIERRTYVSDHTWRRCKTQEITLLTKKLGTAVEFNIRK